MTRRRLTGVPARAVLEQLTDAQRELLAGVRAQQVGRFRINAVSTLAEGEDVWVRAAGDYRRVGRRLRRLVRLGLVVLPEAELEAAQAAGRAECLWQLTGLGTAVLAELARGGA